MSDKEMIVPKRDYSSDWQGREESSEKRECSQLELKEAWEKWFPFAVTAKAKHNRA